MRYPAVEVRNVVVTGCSSGIGAATAAYLRERGWFVVPTARKPADLERLQREGYTPIALDLADSNSVQSAADEALDMLDGRIGALVNNAGVALMGALEDVSRAALQRQFDVNVFGMHELTVRLVPAFRRQGWGRIVNISSVLGRVVLPMMGSYCATKFALEALSDALRIELRRDRIAVVLVEPGAIVSAFRRNAVATAAAALDVENSRFGPAYTREIERRSRQQKQPDLFTRPPEAVAATVCRALESRNPKPRYAVTIPAHLVAWLRRFVPDRALDRLLQSRVPR